MAKGHQARARSRRILITAFVDADFDIERSTVKKGSTDEKI
jgi:hypothetical protein